MGKKGSEKDYFHGRQFPDFIQILSSKFAIDEDNGEC